MRQPNAVQLEAIQRVAARPEGVVIIEYLKAAMDEMQQRLILDNDPQQVRAYQGEARVLDMLLKVWKP